VILFVFVPSLDFFGVEWQEQTSMAMGFAKLFFLGLFKYFIPAALATGIIIKLFLQIKSHFLFESISQKGAEKIIANLSWQDFEFLLSEWFKKQGYTTELTGGGGADGGIDIKLYKEGKLYLVQCKHYKASKVPVMVVRELYGVMTAQKAAGGFVVTSGRFTSEANYFAKNINIELIDKKKIVEILDSVGHLVLQTATPPTTKCPKCGHELVEKTGKFGKFLGCSTYPKCSYTNSL
jgi:restriction system protein